nr:gamma-mobile-trio protein GmtX [uncultured Janthinobacterium sp.]
MKIDPTKFLKELCYGASERKIQSLQLIFSICAEQADRGSDDYSVATIGRLSGERGGPSAAAIRNKPGEDYRALIKAYAAFKNGRDRKVRKLPTTAADELLEGVTDAVLRVRIRLILAENESLRGQLLAARHLANQCTVLDLASPGVASASSQQETMMLTLQEISALRAATCSSTLLHWAWTIDETGRVVTDTGQVVFRAGFATAIEKVVTHFSKP